MSTIPNRDAQDLWPFVRAEIRDAYREVQALIEDPPPGLWTALEARFRKGQAAHGHRNEWLRWSRQRFADEATEELLDLILYPAMRRVVHPGGEREW